MTTPDDNDDTDIIGPLAYKWLSLGASFSCSDINGGFPVDLMWEGMRMASIDANCGITYMHVPDGSMLGLSQDDVNSFIVSMSRLEIILRQWPERKLVTSGLWAYGKSGKTYMYINTEPAIFEYVLAESNNGRTSSLDMLHNYTNWICSREHYKECSHSMLFIDSMRRM